MTDPAATGWLRALPIGRGVQWAVIAGVAVVVQAPWAVLWILGAGVLRGVGATVLAAAAMLAVAELAGRVRWPHRAPRWRTGFGALVGAHRRLLLRGRGAALVRAAGVAWLGGAMAGLVSRASELDAFEARWWTLAIASLALPIALGALAQPVVDADRRLEWLVRAHGGASATRVAASAAVLAIVGALLGVVLAIGVVAVDGASPAYAPTDPSFVARSSVGALAALAGSLVVLGAGLGGLALRAGTWAIDRDDGTRVVLAMAGAAVAAFVAIGILGATGVVAIAAVGLAAASALASRRPQEEP
jgi:hypothetical protein